jgi:DnaJ-domain-containing protein 1
MREQAALHADDPRPAGPNPWWERAAPAAGPPGRGPRGGADDPAARTSDWAARMRDRRSHDAAAAEPVSTANYWSTESLFEESRRLEREEVLTRPNAGQLQDLLAVLDLREDATPADIARAYRRLAKQHHPDHFVSADPDVQTYHAARMRAVIDAYHALRHRESA